MSDQQKYNKLAGKRILVIGGTSGIGYSTAEASIEQGAIVIVSSSNASKVEKTCDVLKSAYPSATARISGHVCNLASEESQEKNLLALLEAATEAKSKKLDHIVYTAADSLAVMPLSEITMEAMKKAGMMRFFGPLFVGKHAPTYLNPGPGSSITLTTGAVAERPIPGWSIVGAYATGLHGITRALALELAPIRCNLVSPGAVNTELWDSFSEEQKQNLFKTVKEGSTTGEVGKPEDVAEAYLYVMRDHNVSGSVISTESGHLLK